VIAAAAMAVGCGLRDSSSVQSQSSAPLRAVSLPDLSHLEAPVQQQMRDAYASLEAKRQSGSSTPAVELAHAYGDFGNLLLAAAYTDAAEPCYLNAQSLAPGEVAWPYYLGHVYRTRGDAEGAARLFERARQIQPDDVATLVWLGAARLELGEADRARSLFAQAVMIQPRSAAALFGLGRADLARRDFSGAVEAFEQALAADPRGSIVHYPLALAYRGLGQTVNAEAHLRLRGDVEVGPDDPRMRDLGELLHSAVAYENRGIRAMDGGDWAQAAAAFRKGLEISPASASLHHKLGTALSLSGDRHGAAEEFAAALRADPGFAQAHYSLGLLFAADGQWPAAVQRFTAAVNADPAYLDARLRLAEALMRTSRPDLALPQYARVLDADRTGQARLGYAMALASVGRFQEARVQLRNGMTEHPERPEFPQAMQRLDAVAPKGR
jgi:tetratricopeptide (TPR) repeat protein